MKKFIFTCGDINGIGPEITIKTLNQIYNPANYEIYFLCPSKVFETNCSLVEPVFDFEIVKKIKSEYSGKVQVINSGECKIETGIPTKKSGKISYRAIEDSCQILYSGKADAVITAPVSKTAMSLAGINFPGQTEIYADYFFTKNYMMMFLSSEMKCGLVTIHEPVKKVSDILSKQLVRQKIETMVISLILDFGIKNPKVALLGLNPHAGENGYIGKEESKIIIPAMEKSEFNQYLEGPFVPDAFFANKMYQKFDAVIGMYHDQLLIPFKMLSFSNGVNYSAGLPIIRTSPDHGTAYDIAYKGTANPDSMISAFQYAELIYDNRSRVNQIAKQTL